MAGQIRIKLAALAESYGLDSAATIATLEPNTLVLTPRPDPELTAEDAE